MNYILLLVKKQNEVLCSPKTLHRRIIRANTVEPPGSDHPNCQAYAVVYENLSPYRFKLLRN